LREETTPATPPSVFARDPTAASSLDYTSLMGELKGAAYAIAAGVIVALLLVLAWTLTRWKRSQRHDNVMVKFIWNSQCRNKTYKM
jgi:hypothetical protein